MGSGSLLLNAKKYAKEPGYIKYYGQELMTSTYNLARMNMFLHGIVPENQILHNGDTLDGDWPTGEETNFDMVLMNPPYSAKWSAASGFLQDERFGDYGVLAPKSKADYAFLLHGLYHLKNNGTMAIVLPHGVLFRGAAEGKIREKLLRAGNIYAVIGLPANLFYNTSIPTCIIVLKKHREGRDVLFIDASRKFEKGKRQNAMTDEHIDSVIDLYDKRETAEKEAFLASFEDIEKNDFNLNIPRYVDTFEKEEEIDLNVLLADMKKTDEELEKVQGEFVSLLKELTSSDDSIMQELDELIGMAEGGSVMNKPKIRFKGYADDWEKRKLGEILCSLQNNTLSRAEMTYKEGIIKNVHYGDILVKYGEIIDVKNEQMPNVIDNAVAEKYKASFLQNGDVIFADTAEDETVGKCSEIAGLTDETVLSGLHTIPYRPQLKFAMGYFGYYLNSGVFHQQLIPLMQGIKVTSISKSAMQNTDIVYPACVDEQKRIGVYFRNLDHLITLHQRKCEEAKILKKYMLQKMFPQNGTNVPEIRFCGFTGDWEQRKVSDLLEERNDQAPESEAYPLMAFIANEGVAPKGERYDRGALIKDAENKLYKKTELGDFIYSSNNLETGSIGLNNYGNASISPVYSIFKPTGIADSDFIGRRFMRKDFINCMVKWRQGVVYGQWKIHESDFLKIEIEIPSLDEQKKIGEYFRNLDRLITLHQRKLEKLQKLKKSMLEKMFV